MKKNMKKMKRKIWKFVYWFSERVRLPSKSVYSMGAQYLTLHSFVQTIFGISRDFVPIQQPTKQTVLSLHRECGSHCTL